MEDLPLYVIYLLQENRLLQKMAPFQPSPLDWHVVPGAATTPVVKRVIRLDVPVENFPNVCEPYWVVLNVALFLPKF